MWSHSFYCFLETFQLSFTYFARQRLFSFKEALCSLCFMLARAPAYCYSRKFLCSLFWVTIRRNIDQGFMTGAVFVDLRKAFDTIDHSILFRKLHFLGIKGKELNWFENYLSSRIQVVGVGGASSDPPHITSGVPRGSILGPLLFVIHINDSPLCIKICNVLIYADDTVLFCAGSNSKVIEDNLNQDLNTLGE